MLGSAAHAATVKVVEDEVFIGGVDGYERVSGTAQARVGDSVMAGEFGVGQIIYANGCVITVTPGAVVSVEAQPPSSCKTPADWSSHHQPVHGEDYPRTTFLSAPRLRAGLVLASIT